MKTNMKRCIAAPMLGAAVMGGLAVGLAGVANAATTPAPTAYVAMSDATGPLPHNNNDFYTHPAFPGYNNGNGMPGYSPSIHVGKHNGA
jgi:hypothetical protein